MESRQEILRLAWYEMTQINALYDADGVRCLPHRWQRNVDNLGDYLMNVQSLYDCLVLHALFHIHSVRHNIDIKP